MTEQERNQVLKMIESGKITAEEGLNLIRTLDQDPAEDEATAEEAEAGTASAPAAQAEEQKAQAEPSDPAADYRDTQAEATVHRLWQIPLWIGIGITLLSAAVMYAILVGPGANFWFYFLLLPLFLGVALTALTVGSRHTRWIFVDVRQRYGEWPERIFLGFPLPMKLIAWFLRTFGDEIPHVKKAGVAEIIQAIETGFTSDEPLVVNVDEGDPGERVRVYIGIPSSRRPIWPAWKNA
jgi:hypothetical protein